MKSLQHQLDRLPPPVCRLLCSLTEGELATMAGVSVSTIRRISQQPNWYPQLNVVSDFLMACGISVRVTIPALHRVNRILDSKRGLSGVKHLKRHSQKAKAIKRIVRVLK